MVYNIFGRIVVSNQLAALEGHRRVTAKNPQKLRSLESRVSMMVVNGRGQVPW